MKKKIGRNSACPCGSGKKFKRCHGLLKLSVESNVVNEMSQRAQVMLRRFEAKEKQREQQQGFSKPIISAELNGIRVVAVGKKLMWSDKWKTVHDFLSTYLKNVLSEDWANQEIGKPLQDRHPILIWYDHLLNLQKNYSREDQEINEAPMTGAAESWYQLAYDLYSLEHNAELQKKLLKRIKNPNMFQGARYEAYVAGTMIRAGYDIEFEDEDSRESTHVEFTATCRKSGNKYSVEVKRRNVERGKVQFRLGRLLHDALKKSARYPRIVFMGADFIDIQDHSDETQLRPLLAKALADLRKFESGNYKGTPLPPAYLLITNRPHDYNLESTNVRSCVMAEGFKMPDFKMDRKFPSMREAHQNRVSHEDIHQLLESIRQHSAIPITFDGNAPELAFAKHLPERLIIGNNYLVPDSQGVIRQGTLTSAAVNEREAIAYLVHHLESGESVINQVPLSVEELAAYRRHPDTFFGVDEIKPRKVLDQMDWFYFFLKGYEHTPKERLLEFMADRPDINELKNFSRSELREVYAEQCAWVAIRNSSPAAEK
jgi:hypothetical protein